MTAVTYDLAELVRHYADSEEQDAELGEELEDFLNPLVKNLRKYGKVKEGDSFGLVIANTEYAGRYSEIWDDPIALLTNGLVLGWGPEWQQFAANALRKMRAAARLGRNTLDVAANNPELFREVVPSFTKDRSNLFPWGDFPHGGAILEGIAGTSSGQLLVGASALTAEEDEMISSITVEFYNTLVWG